MPVLDKSFLSFKTILLSAICAASLSACGDKIKREIPVTQLGQEQNSAGIAIVQKYDTLWDISKRFDLPLRDIIALNKIKPPFIVQQGQRLQLPPPREYKVRAGDTLYEISRMFETDMSSVARLNNMRTPYTIQIGEVLRMPSPSGADRVKVASQSGGMVRQGQAFTSKSDYDGSAAKPSSKPSVSSSSQSTVTPAAKPAVKSTRVKSDKTMKVPEFSGSGNGRFAMPVSGPVISDYGPKSGGLHNDGINIGAPRGAAVKAAENGIVAYTGDEIGGYGNLVLIRHSGGYMTAYAHLGSIKVKKGQNLSRGQVLGTVGASGNVDKPQLHFEIRKGSKALNPKPLI
jgi:murein DD-endopeptidase MepM/ murein hydrolase activator NlpD